MAQDLETPDSELHVGESVAGPPKLFIYSSFIRAWFQITVSHWVTQLPHSKSSHRNVPLIEMKSYRITSSSFCDMGGRVHSHARPFPGLGSITLKFWGGFSSFFLFFSFINFLESCSLFSPNNWINQDISVIIPIPLLFRRFFSATINPFLPQHKMLNFCPYLS